MLRLLLFLSIPAIAGYFLYKNYTKSTYSVIQLTVAIKPPMQDSEEILQKMQSTEFDEKNYLTEYCIVEKLEDIRALAKKFLVHAAYVNIQHSRNGDTAADLYEKLWEKEKQRYLTMSDINMAEKINPPYPETDYITVSIILGFATIIPKCRVDNLDDLDRVLYSMSFNSGCIEASDISVSPELHGERVTQDHLTANFPELVIL